MTETPDFKRVRRDRGPNQVGVAADDELRKAQERIAELEHELGGIRARALAVDQIRRQRQALDQQAAAVEIRRHEMMHEASQEIERRLAEADQEIEARRAENDHQATMRRHGLAAEMRRVEAEARGRAEGLLRSARAQVATARETAAQAAREATRVVTNAEADAAALRARVRAEAARGLTHPDGPADHTAGPATDDGDPTGPTTDGPAGPTAGDGSGSASVSDNDATGHGATDLDERFERTRAHYEQVLAALDAKVTDLRSTFDALVTGLRAIADGGLANLPPGLDELDPCLTSPTDPNPDDEPTTGTTEAVDATDALVDALALAEAADPAGDWGGGPEDPNPPNGRLDPGGQVGADGRPGIPLN